MTHLDGADKLAAYFASGHLPARLRPISEPCGTLAAAMLEALPPGAERTAGMRKLLEAKDCFVRAALDA